MRPLDRLAPLAGVGFVVLYVAGLAFMLGDEPGFVAAQDEVAAYYTDREDQILTGGVLATIAVPFLIWFAGALRATLSDLDARLGATALAGGAAAAAILGLGASSNLVGALRVGENDTIAPETAAVFFDIFEADHHLARRCRICNTLDPVTLQILPVDSDGTTMPSSSERRGWTQ